MARPALSLLCAGLWVSALSPVLHAEEPRAHDRHHHHVRARAKADELKGRAPRDGSREAKHHAPAEKAESIGSPNDGHLKGGAHIDLSRPYFRVVPAYESGDTRWGMPTFIRMIDRAAHSVNRRFPGSVLDVGDISQKSGGDLRRHHSHESGRDADLGFYVVDTKGKQIHARTFIKFDPSMTSPTVPGARYDLARNWTFVQEILTDPVARVSHVFVAEWIRHELLAYARPRTSHALWERAAMVLMQPHNSLPHDDHIHVRISCPREAHATCVELAKVARRPKTRALRKGSPGGHVLRTPVPPAHAPLVHGNKPPAAAVPTPHDAPALPVPPAPDEDHDVEVLEDKLDD